MVNGESEWFVDAFGEMLVHDVDPYLPPIRPTFGQLEAAQPQF